MSRLLAVHGSPRKGGNSEIMLDAAIDGAASAGAEVVKFRLAELDFEPCRSCGGCNKKGECVVSDDMHQINSKLIEYDRFIFASPVYFKGPSAQMKAMIDRCQCLWVAKYWLKVIPWKTDPPRKGIFISSCATEGRNMFGPSISIIKSLFAVLDIEYTADLLVEGLEDKGAVNSRPDVLEKARQLGKMLAEQ